MKVLHSFGHIVLALAAAAGFSAVVMLLWNLLMPVIFGLACISFWQALGLLVLCRLLFGGFGRKFWGMKHHHNPMHEKWLNMTPEEREVFIRHRRFGFGHNFFDKQNTEKQD